jgi:hypothetical protein
MRSVVLPSILCLGAASSGRVNFHKSYRPKSSLRVLYLQALEAMLRLTPREEIASPSDPIGGKNRVTAHPTPL